LNGKDGYCFGKKGKGRGFGLHKAPQSLTNKDNFGFGAEDRVKRGAKTGVE